MKPESYPVVVNTVCPEVAVNMPRDDVPFTDEPGFWNYEPLYTFMVSVDVSNQSKPPVGLLGAVAETSYLAAKFATL